MKRIRQMLALALALILTLSLAPIVAQADPPASGCFGGGSHRWGLNEDTATCTTAGTKHWSCRRCRVQYFEVSPAKGHDWRMEEYESSSCTQDGYVKYKCTRCSETYEETIPGGHDWTVWYLEGEQNREPTCTEPGVMTRHCDRCWTTEVVTIPALGHQWDGERSSAPARASSLRGGSAIPASAAAISLRKRNPPSTSCSVCCARRPSRRIRS